MVNVTLGGSMRWVLVGVVTFVVLAGCSSTGGTTTGLSNAAICSRALATVALSEVSDSAQSRLRHAKDAANELNSLASQTQDLSLSTALRSAANTAGAATSHWSTARLAAWVTQEQARFDALRRACL
jgi:hypothetical protein